MGGQALQVGKEGFVSFAEENAKVLHELGYLLFRERHLQQLRGYAAV